MHVVQFVPHQRLGGMQTIVDQLDAGLPAKGIESEVCSLDGRPPARSTTLSLLRWWWSVYRQLRVQRVGAVVAHTPMAALFGLTAAFAAGVPRRLIVMHTSPDSVTTPKNAILRILGALGIVTHPVYCGFAVRAAFERSGNPFLSRGTVIQNGVDVTLQRGRLRDRRGGSRPLRVVTVGRLVPSKNLELLIDATAEAKAEIELHICGGGECAESLRAKSARLGTDVIFHGPLARAELESVLTACDVFAFPTLSEGLPLSLIDAAALGLPVLASDIPSNREVMAEAAIYCAADDADQWVRELRRFSSGEVDVSALQAAGSERALLFASARMVEEYAKLMTADDAKGA